MQKTKDQQLQEMIDEIGAREIVNRVLFLEEESRRPAPPFAGATEFATSDQFNTQTVAAVGETKPLIDRFLGQLSRAISETEMVVDQLDERLYTVLGPVAPPGEGANSTDREMSPLAGDLNRFVARLQAQNDYLRLIMSRLELPKRSDEEAKKRAASEPNRY